MRRRFSPRRICGSKRYGKVGIYQPHHHSGSPISRSLRFEDMFAGHCLLPTQVDRRYHPREYAQPPTECPPLLCDVAMLEHGRVRGYRNGLSE